MRGEGKRERGEEEGEEGGGEEGEREGGEEGGRGERGEGGKEGGEEEGRVGGEEGGRVGERGRKGGWGRGGGRGRIIVVLRCWGSGPAAACCRGAIDITQHNLAYVTALYTVNDKMRLELLEGGRAHSDNSLREGDLPMPLLLSNPTVASRQSRLLLLLLVVSCAHYPRRVC